MRTRIWEFYGHTIHRGLNRLQPWSNWSSVYFRTEAQTEDQKKNIIHQFRSRFERQLVS